MLIKSLARLMAQLIEVVKDGPSAVVGMVALLAVGTVCVVVILLVVSMARPW
jgi:hypothetical protein